MPRSATLEFEDRLSESDALMLALEADPVLRSTIVSAWVLDGTPDPERMRVKLEQAIALIPRLRQRVVTDPLGLAPPRWEEDPHFDLGFHVRRVRAPEPGGERELLDLAQPIAMQAFDMDRPLWEIHQVEGLSGGRTAVIMKLHHAISDGVGLVKMTECLVERGPEAGEQRPAPTAEAPAPRRISEEGLLARVVEAASHRVRSDGARLGSALGALRRSGWAALRDPRAAVEQVGGTLASVGRMLAPPEAALSPIMTSRSTRVHFEAFQMPLEQVKQAGRRLGCSVNDAYVAVVGGGLRRYHEALGEPVEKLRMMMPINVRTEEKADRVGNQFAPVRCEVPVGIADPGERMRAVQALCRQQRDEPALPYMEQISSVLGGVPGAFALWLVGEGQKTVDFTTSNVPGPRRACYMSGAKVEAFYPFGPLAGAGANFTVFSYAGTLYVGANLDPAAVTDPALLLECMKKSAAELLALA
jgi:WS/DGAT/MGAT family acyltransferase